MSQNLTERVTDKLSDELQDFLELLSATKNLESWIDFFIFTDKVLAKILISRLLCCSPGQY